MSILSEIAAIIGKIRYCSDSELLEAYEFMHSLAKESELEKSLFQAIIAEKNRRGLKLDESAT